MKNISLFIVVVLVLTILTSCWDKRLLKDHSLILAVGYDLNEDETISKTVSFPRDVMNAGSPEELQSESEVISTSGNTVGDADIELERLLAQEFDRSKARILLIGEDLAKYGIFSTLDSMYRDPRGPINATVAVVKSRAEDGLKIQKDQSFFTSEFYYDLLKSSEDSGIIKRENIQSISPVLLSGREDIALPLINITSDDKAYLEGLALFSGNVMTGQLEEVQSVMYLILTKDVKEEVTFNFHIDNQEENYAKNFVTFAVRKEKRKFKVYEDDGDIKARVALNLKIEIEEYPHDNLDKRATKDKLENEISKKLTDLGEKTIDTAQKANSDILGIGEKVKAHHYSIWEDINWREVYPEVPIDITVDVEITQHGIIY